MIQCLGVCASMKVCFTTQSVCLVYGSCNRLYYWAPGTSLSARQLLDRCLQFNANIRKIKDIRHWPWRYRSCVTLETTPKETKHHMGKVRRRRRSNIAESNYIFPMIKWLHWYIQYQLASHVMRRGRFISQVTFEMSYK